MDTDTDSIDIPFCFIRYIRLIRGNKSEFHLTKTDGVLTGDVADYAGKTGLSQLSATDSQLIPDWPQKGAKKSIWFLTTDITDVHK